MSFDGKQSGSGGMDNRDSEFSSKKNSFNALRVSNVSSANQESTQTATREEDSLDIESRTLMSRQDQSVVNDDLTDTLAHLKIRKPTLNISKCVDQQSQLAFDDREGPFQQNV